MKAMMHAAAWAGADTLIIPDLGCGVFGNDPHIVGRIAGDELKTFSSYFSQVIFTGKIEFCEAAAKALGVASPFGINEKTLSLPPVFHYSPNKFHKGLLASPGLSGPLLNPQLGFSGVREYARHGYIKVTCKK